MESSNLWSRPAGYRDILRMAIPLVLSTSANTLQMFVDRMYLAWYSPRAMAAALPSGLLAFSLQSFFIGVAIYANTFVAQYHGAKQPRRIGPAIWQAVHFIILASILFPLIAPFSTTIFRLIGHEPGLQVLEASYFRALMLGSFFGLYSAAVSCLFTGLGRNWPVMWVNFIVTLVNIVLDYAMIFGRLGFPEWGIAGAAWATVSAQAVGAVIYTILVFNPKHERLYAMISGWRVDWRLFKRLMRFGLPSGLQFMLDISAVTVFTFIVGWIGTVELAATQLAFQINSMAFMPMIGFGIAASTQVGQWLGRNEPEMAKRATWSTFHLTFAYMAFLSVFYVLRPNWFIDPFAAKAADVDLFTQVRPMAITIIYFVAVYSLFDTLNIILSNALKGAGDTHFVMYMSLSMGWLIMVIPTWAFCIWLKMGGIYLAWIFLSLYVCVIGLAFLARFNHGKWKTMRVIEHHPAPPDLTDLAEPALTQGEA